MADIALAFEQAVVDTLAIKCERALERTGCTRLVVAGGVGANRYLRAQLQERTAQRGARVFFPRPDLCTDNGAMIAMAAAMRINAGVEMAQKNYAFNVLPRWPLAQVAPA